MKIIKQSSITCRYKISLFHVDQFMGLLLTLICFFSLHNEDISSMRGNPYLMEVCFISAFSRSSDPLQKHFNKWIFLHFYLARISI